MGETKREGGRGREGEGERERERERERDKGEIEREEGRERERKRERVREEAKSLTSSGVCWSTIMVGLSDFMARLLGGFPNIPPPRWVPTAPKLPAFPGECMAAGKLQVNTS